MMEGSDYWNLRLVNYFVVCFVVFFQLISAQEGFSSVQCCAELNVTDVHNIIWTTDENWFPDRLGCHDIRAEKSNTSYDKARFFESHYANKWCYNYTTVKDQDYLIRGTFLVGDVEAIPPGTFFEVLVGHTPIVVVNSSEGDLVVEGIFRAVNDQTNLCLSKENGNPYISKLELRALNGTQYSKNHPSSVSKLTHRVNVGSTGVEEIRYPQDFYDRIWMPEQSPDQTAYNILSPTATIPIDNANETVPPIEVLQTARTHPESLKFLHNDLETGSYELFLHFLELNHSVQPGQRVFDVYINGVKRQEIDIIAGGSKYSAVVLSFTANGFLNLTLTKVSNGSQIGPICNAYEILKVQTWDQETTQEDVDAILKLRDDLLMVNRDNELLKSWSGDPCLPLPWYGLTCDHPGGPYVITKLNLSSSHLQGSIPPSITNLTHLSELNMSNNGFIDTIPEFPDSSILTLIDLSHNNLTGKIPVSFASLPYLKTLYFGCNPRFSKELPASLNITRLTTDKGMCSRQRSQHSARKIVIGTVAGGSLLVAGAVAIFFVYTYRRKLKAHKKFDGRAHAMTKNVVFSIPSMDDILLKSISIENFTLQSIEAATHNYKTLIGEGGFGSVYRGTLPDGQEVAVKVRSATSTQGTREFDNELNLLSAIRHENLVPLIGYCCESDQQMLVYPFMSNGSLQDRLYGEAAKRKILDWPTRLSIALGSARGLTYLHTFAGRCVIHRDVKSSNILLDQSMCAKVADFGFSKYAPQEGDSGVSLEVRGTAGYLDPEYYSTQHLSAKSDVFSFGVVLLEIVSGREPLNIHRPRNEWSLVEWAKPYIRSSRIEEIVDPTIKGGYHAEAMWRVVEVALACIEPFSANRPNMADIVRELEDALIIENNASEYMKSIDSFGGSHRFSIERPIALPPTPTPTEPSPILSQPAPPQPR